MIHFSHLFALEFRDLEGRSLGQRTVTPNWEPAAEWARFEAMRRAPIDQWPAWAGAEIEILPVYNGGAPYTEGFRAVVAVDPAHPVSSDFPLTWFKRMVDGLSAELVKEGKLTNGERFTYKLLAFENRRAAPAKSAGFKVEETPTPPPALPAGLAELTAQSVPDGVIQDSEVPVYIPERILSEAVEQAEAAAANETGGVLLGHLLQDAQGPEAAVLVTAQVPAQHTEAKCESLVFTAETWTAVGSALALRKRDKEMMVGWWHSHPSKYWCRECPEERRRQCPLKQQSFLSAHDIALHETVFPNPYNLALLITNAEEGLHHALFGWHRGQVAKRGFFVLRESPEDVPARGPRPRARQERPTTH